MLRFKNSIYAILLFGLFLIGSEVYALPKNFVYLRSIDPSILQELRYAGYHNFVGKPLPGYKNYECIVTYPTAYALAGVQSYVKHFGYTLKMYDCYRPQRTVDAFIAWSRDPTDEKMKREFYPEVNKKDFFRLSYVAARSGHSRGSTVDLTLVKIPIASQPKYHPNDVLVACYADYGQRFRDNSIDMGTGFDCMDPRSWPSSHLIAKTARQNRIFLSHAMQRFGFIPYDKEWWHFTLRHELYPNTYFNFPIVR